MRRTILLTALLGALALPTVASAATVHVVRGAGWGHGIGMSQYGAYGFAQNGRSYEQILRHYYRGTEIGRAPGRPVRVLLQSGHGYVRFRGATRGPGGRALDPGVTYVVRRSGGRLALLRGSKRVGTFNAPLRVNRPGRPLRLMGRAINGLGNGLYRGSLEFRPGWRGVNAINSLPIDPYVQGVVAGEMPSSWHPQALRAQAIAARTYALATRKPGTGFDHYPDTRSQVYRGVRGETRSTNAAVRATANEIVTYDGRPAVTYFFSTSGGRTENVEFSFVGSRPQPHLKSVPDPYDKISPKHRWRKRFSTAALTARLGTPGRYRKIRVLKRGKSPRIVRARVYGTRGSRVLTGPQIRARLGLNDTWARFTTVSTSRAKRSAKLSSAAFGAPRIRGSFRPVPGSRVLAIERREGRAWVRAGTVRTAKNGSFLTTLRRSGVYRVRSGSVAGPAVRAY